MAKLHGSWIWYELMTLDPAAAKRFYDPLVGWTITPDVTPDGYGMIVNPDGGMTGGMMRLTTEMCDAGSAPAWLGYIGVDDVDAFLPRLEQAGGTVAMPARDVPMAGRIAMVTDCCGAPFYVMTPTPPPGGGEITAFSTTLPGRCGWNELMAGNFDRAIEFYTSLFGWDLPPAMDMGAFGKYQFIEHDGIPIGAIMPKMEAAPAAMWNHYFRVPGIDAAKSQAEASGAQIVNGPMEVPGGDWIVQGMDPQGAFFSLVGGR